jgi:hypothetical protein
VEVVRHEIDEMAELGMSDLGRGWCYALALRLEAKTINRYLQEIAALNPPPHSEGVSANDQANKVHWRCQKEIHIRRNKHGKKPSKKAR